MRAATLTALLIATAVGHAQAQVVPRPKALRDAPWAHGARIAESGFTRVVCDTPGFEPQVDALLGGLRRLGCESLEYVEDGAHLTVRKGSLPEGATYRIQSSEGGLVVTAATPEGVAHAAATLLQLVRVENGRAHWNEVMALDGPDLPFRCFMVDLGRNPHGPETLRHIVDVLAYYKVGYLQLHLTDDQLCSWPSKVFPKLADERAGWTWEEFVALEAYSQARGVTVIPELDVPGHSTLLRRAYPEVFGAEPTELASSPAAQAGVEALLGEMMSVFESTPYVHVGGDEAYGVPEEIQRDFLNRLDGFVRSHGRRTLVWEGPQLGEGENKVGEGVVHMNWRTVNVSAQAMLDAGYEVVNAAWDPLYVVDHYPRTMFTAVDLERLYAFDVQRFAHVNHDIRTFAEPHRTKTREGLLGFCMPWWEGREENVLALCTERIAAVAAAAWNRAGESDFAEFEARQRRALPRLERLSGFRLPVLPIAAPETQTGNLAYLGVVLPSRGASQPHFGPQRLTNGVTDRFDHFLGFPTKPTPLEIRIDLREPGVVGRVVVHEDAVGQSHEVYELLVSSDGTTWESVGRSGEGTRGESTFVAHTFEPREVRSLLLRTEGCHGLTFPSFSRLTEVQAFEE